MKVKEKYTIPAKEGERTVRRRCDLCGAESKGDDWDAGNFEVKETEVTVTVKHRAGEQYPEGGFGDGIEIDLCPKCFRNRLVPWLKSQGANIKYEDWDW